MLTDSHCHLASRQFKEDIDAVIQRAVQSGVTRMVTIGTDPEDSSRCIDLANQHAAVYAATGVHPCSVTGVTCDDWLKKIRVLAGEEKVAAIGEIGLDYFHPPPDGWSKESYRGKQGDFFRAQLELAAELELNVVIHQRDRGNECWPDIQRIMEPFHGRLRAVFHCFTHSWESAKPLINEGHLISFTGISTFKSAELIQQCALQATPDSFMLETDAPYLAPVPHRGKRCEPAHTLHTAQFVAQLRGIPLKQLAKETERNTESFFRFNS
ncbi:MAG: TatD family hydrolase [Verrucomicrobiales bacterium]